MLIDQVFFSTSPSYLESGILPLTPGGLAQASKTLENQQGSTSFLNSLMTRSIGTLENSSSLFFLSWLSPLRLLASKGIQGDLQGQLQKQLQGQIHLLGYKGCPQGNPVEFEQLQTVCGLLSAESICLLPSLAYTDSTSGWSRNWRTRSTAKPKWAEVVFGGLLLSLFGQGTAFMPYFVQASDSVAVVRGCSQKMRCSTSF